MGRKIGFAINSIQGGAGEPWTTGLDDKKWTKGVVDPRELLRFWDIPEDKCIKFMTFGQEGTYYVWANNSSTRGGSDSLSKWIYIPNGVKISGKEILEYESKAKEEERSEVLEKLFATEFPYESDGNSIHVANSNDKKKYAVRYYDTEDQLADIIGEKRFQQYYSDYKVIFLIDRQSGIKVGEGAVVDDLTDRPMIQIKADEDKKCCSFVSTGKCIWYKHIAKNFFLVDDAENNPDGIVKTIPVEELNIYINGQLIKEEGVTLTEKECEDCTIKIEELQDKSSIRTPKYKPYKKNNENILLAEGKKYPIHLEKKLSCFEYKIQLSNKEEATLVIHSKNGGLNEKAPFSAYVAEPNPFSMRSKEKKLILDNFYKFKLIMIGFGLGLVVASIVFFTLFYHGNEDNTATAKNVGDTTNVVLDDDIYSLDAAINYLDSHKSWNRDSMERYDDLKGLFDAMNDFRLNAVIDEYSHLNKSTSYSFLVEVATKNISNGWDPKTGTHNPQYNQVGDKEISYTNYINWIDKDRNKEETNKEETNKEETKKEETKKEETKKEETKKEETKKKETKKKETKKKETKKNSFNLESQG